MRRPHAERLTEDETKGGWYLTSSRIPSEAVIKRPKSDESYTSPHCKPEQREHAEAIHIKAMATRGAFIGVKCMTHIWVSGFLFTNPKKGPKQH